MKATFTWTQISSITIPVNVTTFESSPEGTSTGPFSGCNKLTNIEYEGTAEDWQKIIFIGDDAADNLTVVGCEF